MEVTDRAISTIVTLALSGDERTERSAVCTLANLLEMGACMRTRISLRACARLFAPVRACARQCAPGPPHPLHAAVRAAVELHDRFLAEQGLPPLVALAVAKDLQTKGEACRALANLTANSA